MSKSLVSRNNGRGPALPPWLTNLNDHALRMVFNDTTLSRAALIAMAGGSLPPIDVDTECRYPKQLELKHYQDMYDREGVATRVVSVYPEEAWQMPPDIYETEDLNKETEFEADWEEMNNGDEDKGIEGLNVLTHLQAADEKAGVGRYGGVLLGFDGNEDLAKPVAGADGTKRDGRFKERKLIYLRTMTESELGIKTYETNVLSPRFGKPLMYQIPVIDNNSNQRRTTQSGVIEDHPKRMIVKVS